MTRHVVAGQRGAFYHSSDLLPTMACAGWWVQARHTLDPSLSVRCCASRHRSGMWCSEGGSIRRSFCGPLFGLQGFWASPFGSHSGPGYCPTVSLFSRPYWTRGWWLHTVGYPGDADTAWRSPIPDLPAHGLALGAPTGRCAAGARCLTLIPRNGFSHRTLALQLVPPRHSVRKNLSLA